MQSPKRKQIRLKHYDYSQDGYYFVTICTRRGGVTPPLQRHACLGGVTPPLQNGGVTSSSPLQRPTLGQIVAYFKYQSTKSINALHGTPCVPIWQRGYYEHVIRNESALSRIREYIQNNPEKERYDWDKLDV